MAGLLHASKVHGTMRGMRVAVLIFITALASFTLGALYSSLRGDQTEVIHVPRELEYETIEGIPFFMRDSLTAVRCGHTCL
jgi:hypothetical protein